MIWLYDNFTLEMDSVPEKRVICRFFRLGKCKQGEGCSFVHPGREHVEPAPAEPVRHGTGQMGLKGGSERKVICKFFKQGKCKEGEACSFSHLGQIEHQPAEPPRQGTGGLKDNDIAGKQICKYFLTGNCKFGLGCQNLHVRREDSAAVQDIKLICADCSSEFLSRYTAEAQKR